MLVDGLTTAEQDTVAAHLADLQRREAAGVVLLFGRTQPTDASTFGIVIFRAGSLDGARQIRADDPAARERVMGAEVLPFRIAGVVPGLSAYA